MKILLIRNGWTNQDYGGAEELLSSLGSVLQKQGVEVIIGTTSQKLLRKAHALKLTTTAVPYSTRQILTKHRAVFLPVYALGLVKGYFSYINLLKKIKPDVLHATSQQDCIAGTLAAKKLKIPVVWSDHGELKNSVGFSLLPPWGLPGLVLKFASRYVNYVLMVNPDDIKQMQEKLHCSIKRVPNGILKGKVVKHGKAEFDLVFASRVIREKGVFELLEAYSQLMKIRHNTSLLIAGEGPSLHKAKEFVSSNDLTNVRFEKYSDEAIQRAKVFVLPTYTEAQSLALIKACMYGKTIVTTDIPGNRHFLKNNTHAVLVKPRSSHSLFLSLASILKDRSRSKRLEKNALDYFKKDGDLNKVVEKHYLPLYNSLLEK